MMSNNFTKIKTKDPVINTYPWESLRKNPKVVEENYKAHAITHMSLGDTGHYISTLKRNVTKNKNSSIGAIIGPYGYGKTSTAIHIWQTSQEELGMLSIPPFEWYQLSDMIEAVTGWVQYQFEKGPRHLVKPLMEIYEKYRDKSLNEIASDLGMDIEKAQKAYDDGKLNLGIQPIDVIEFLVKISELCTNGGDFSGLAVFIDELQETADKYSSIKDFQTDLFAFADKVPTFPGKLAIIFTMPDTLEATINTTRPDIIHRFKQSSLYLRVEAIYGRKFPKELWGKFSEVFDFQDEIFKPIEEETLDSIGQIAMRKDLGAGPRTVINALVEAVKHYENLRKSYTPIDFVNGFLDGKISFEERGKFSTSVRTALENRIIQSKPEYERVIKLISAFPLGCPKEITKKYSLAISLDQLLSSEVYGEIIYNLSEGYSIRSLLTEEVTAEPTYIRLIRDNFIRGFAPDKRHAQMAMSAFKRYILGKYFEPGRTNQLDKWQWVSEESEGSSILIIDLFGSFLFEYPHREVRLLVGVSPQSGTPEWGGSLKEINFAFLLNYAENPEKLCQISFPPENMKLNEVFIQLNLLRAPRETISLPRITQSYPPEKMSALFMLSLLEYIDDIEEKIPTPEKSGELRVMRERLLQHSTQILFGSDIEVDSRFDIIEVGETLIKRIFEIMCKTQYPDYITLITNSMWEKNLQAYIKALRDPKTSTRIARGKESLETQKTYLANMFGETSKQKVEGLIKENLARLIKIDNWGGRGSDLAEVTFSLHPLESVILDQLEASEYSEQRKEGRIKRISVEELFSYGREFGYKNKEIVNSIQILNARELVAFDARKNEISQLIRSIEDLKDSVSEKVELLSSTVRKLTDLPVFEPERFYPRLEDCRSKIGNVNQQDEIDEIIDTLERAQYGLNKFISSSYANYVNELRKFSSEIDQIVSVGIPENLKKRIKGGEEPWGIVLEESRQRLRKRYDEMIIEYKELSKKIHPIIKNSPEDIPSADDLLEIFQEKTTIAVDIKRLENRKGGMLDYQNQLGEWINLQSKSNGVYQEAITAQASFGDDRFIQMANQISEGIKEQFNYSPIDALADIKEYRGKIISLEEDIVSWQRHRREYFIESKKNYESALRRLGDENPVVMTNFDPYTSSDKNVSALAKEFLDHLQNILIKLTQFLDGSLNELRYFNEIQNIEIEIAEENILNDIEKSKTMGAEIKELLQEKNEISEQINEVEAIQNRALDYNKKILSALLQREPENEFEKELLDIIKSNSDDPVRGVELKYILIRLMKDKQDIEIEKVRFS